MLGTEDGSSIAEQKSRLNKGVDNVDNLLNLIKAIDDNAPLSSAAEKERIIDQMRYTVQSLSTRLQEVRKKKLGKEIHMRSFMKQVCFCTFLHTTTVHMQGVPKKYTSFRLMWRSCLLLQLPCCIGYGSTLHFSHFLLQSHF